MAAIQILRCDLDFGVLTNLQCWNIGCEAVSLSFVNLMSCKTSVQHLNPKLSIHANNCCNIIPCTPNDDMRKGRQSSPAACHSVCTELSYNNYSHELIILGLVVMLYCCTVNSKITGRYDAKSKCNILSEFLCSFRCALKDVKKVSFFNFNSTDCT